MAKKKIPAERKPRKLCGNKWAGLPRASVSLPGVNVEVSMRFLEKVDAISAAAVKAGAPVRKASRPAVIRWAIEHVVRHLTETGELPFEWSEE